MSTIINGFSITFFSHSNISLQKPRSTWSGVKRVAVKTLSNKLFMALDGWLVESLQIIIQFLLNLTAAYN